jgi:leader peptidase (prepilin peptidase) / N-methyltransferase
MIEEFILYNPWFIYVGIGLLSLCVGSLLNVVVYRLPLMLQREWKEQCYELLAVENKDHSPPLNLFLPRSFCPQCKTQVKSWHNIPILSYLLLKGACYQCKSPISIRYPLTELFSLFISLYACWHFTLAPQLIFVLLALWLLIPMVLIDLEHQLLPDSLTLSLLWLGLIANTQALFTDLPNAVLSAAGAYLFLWLFIKLFYLITGKIGMGHGDFKLFAAFGAWFGWMALPFILLVSSICGAVIGVIYLKINNKSNDTTIPFGPFLCMAGIIYLFWGKSLINWYLHLWMY